MTLKFLSYYLIQTVILLLQNYVFRTSNTNTRNKGPIQNNNNYNNNDNNNNNNNKNNNDFSNNISKYY